MKSAPRKQILTLLAAAVVAATVSGFAATPAAGEAPAKPSVAPKPAPAAKSPIVLHRGVPGLVFLGQPLTEFLAKFPGAVSTPFAGQSDVVRVQVADQGISILAMGITPATMTVESIGFNWQGSYEGVKAGNRRTSEGIGPGSTVNELLEAYGKPADVAQESRRSALAPQQAPGPDAVLRYLYRSDDATAATFFIVKGSEVTRMATSHPASVERYILKKGPAAAPAPAQPGSATPPAKPAPPR